MPLLLILVLLILTLLLVLPLLLILVLLILTLLLVLILLLRTLLILLELAQGLRGIVARLGIARIYAQCLLVGLEALLVVPQLVERIAHIVEGIRLLGRRGPRRPRNVTIVVQGLLVLLLAIERIGQVEGGLQGIGIGMQGLAIFHLGLGMLPLPIAPIAPAHAGRRILRPHTTAR